MGIREGLGTTLESIQVEEYILMILGKHVGEWGDPIGGQPDRREWIGWLGMESGHVCPARDEVRQIRRLTIHR